MRLLPQIDSTKVKSQGEKRGGSWIGNNNSTSLSGKGKGESRIEESTVRNHHNEKQDAEERPPLSFDFRDSRVPVTYDTIIPYDDVLLAISSRPFQAWIEKTSKVFGSKCIALNGVDIENVKIIDGRVDCINMNVDSDLVDEDDQIGNMEINGTCCLRDSAVGILVELRCVDDGTVWSVLVDQPRINVGAVSALELPIASIDNDDDETLIGREVEELKKTCHLNFSQSNMINLTQRAYEKNSVHNASGLCPSLGTCSEYIRIMYMRKEITKNQLNAIRRRLSKTREEGAAMSLRVIPLADMWKVSADMKVVCALFLLERAALTEKSHGKEYYMVEDEKISDENSGDGVGVGGVRSKLKRIMSFSKRPPMFGY